MCRIKLDLHMTHMRVELNDSSHSRSVLEHQSASHYNQDELSEIAIGLRRNSNPNVIWILTDVVESTNCNRVTEEPKRVERRARVSARLESSHATRMFNKLLTVTRPRVLL